MLRFRADLRVSQNQTPDSETVLIKGNNTLLGSVEQTRCRRVANGVSMDFFVIPPGVLSRNAEGLSPHVPRVIVRTNKMSLTV